MVNIHLLTLYILFVSVARLSFATSDRSQVEQVTVTFYGWPDNSPPGPRVSCGLESRDDCNAGSSACTSTNSNPSSTPSSAPGSKNFGKYTETNLQKRQDDSTQCANGCGPRGEIAGGTGTYEDPLTMASAGEWFCYLEVVYLPYLQKYLRYEDYCQACVEDVPKGIHIDIWTGSNTTSGGGLQQECENTLTPTPLQSMIRNPPPNLTVDCKPKLNTSLLTSSVTDSPSASTLFIPNGKSAFCNGTEIYQINAAGILYAVSTKIWLTCILLFVILRNSLFD